MFRVLRAPLGGTGAGQSPDEPRDFVARVGRETARSFPPILKALEALAPRESVSARVSPRCSRSPRRDCAQDMKERDDESREGNESRRRRCITSDASDRAQGVCFPCGPVDRLDRRSCRNRTSRHLLAGRHSELERVGGTPAAWVRGNRTFANELRRQFLLWRSLPIETIEHYRRMTAEELGVDEA